jgi:acyl-CoA dehydrogenase
MKWEEDGVVPRALWRKAGEQGLLGMTMPEEYGGAGVDFLYNAILIEEQGRAIASGPAFSLHNDIVVPYLLHYGNEEQKKKWIPKACSGELITAIAMTEPGTGSDLQSVKTSAVMDGNHWVINGSKTFISNGQLADLVIVVAKTDPKLGAKGTSLIAVETTTEGFKRGRNLEKIGMKAQDTSELFFDNVRVPADNLLGGPGMGFIQLMQQLPQERLLIAVTAVAAMDLAVRQTLQYTKERTAFGRPLFGFQNTKFKLAEAATEVAVSQAFLDQCIERHLKGELDVSGAAMAKMWTTERLNRVVDDCVQLFGGYGYMSEYPIARAWTAARVQRIFGGTTEIMKEIISRTL